MEADESCNTETKEFEEEYDQLPPDETIPEDERAFQKRQMMDRASLEKPSIWGLRRARSCLPMKEALLGL